MKSYINLLPLAYRRRQIGLHCLRQWSCLWLVALAITGLLGWSQWSKYRAGLIRLNSLRQEYKPVEETIQNVARFRQTLDELQKREALVLELADEQSMFTLLGLLSRATRACGGRVSIQNLVVQRSDDGKRVKKVLTLSGLAVDNQAVASFVAELRKIKAFQHVQLKDTGMTAWNNIESRTYSMQCVF